MRKWAANGKDVYKRHMLFYGNKKIHFWTNCCWQCMHKMVRYQMCQRAQNWIRCAPIAQLVEHLTLNQGVQGSNPCWCTIEKQIPFGICFSMSIIRNGGSSPKGRDCEGRQSGGLASKERSNVHFIHSYGCLLYTAKKISMLYFLAAITADWK